VLQKFTKVNCGSRMVKFQLDSIWKNSFWF